MLKLRVKIDQKAALLCGRVLPAMGEIEIAVESMDPALRSDLVSLLDMSGPVPVVGEIMVSDITESAIVSALQLRITEREQKAAEKAAKLADYAVRARAEIERIIAQRDPLNILIPDTDVRVPDGISQIYFSFSRVDSAGCVWNDCRKIQDELEREYAPKIAASIAEIDAHNAALIERETPRVLAEIAERKRLAEIAETEKKAAREIELTEMAAERLRTGYWEKETGSYNERRYSSPWCAQVDFSSGAKPNYTFGESTGKWGKAGLLRVKCAPGDIIAHGQKDLRRPGNSDHTLLHMRSNGRMTEVDKTEAFRIWTENQKQPATA